ncbi:hypothetical protein NDU88_002970 [Pleurodeles waltl]|uniref:Uncharacterized protein n=1 Tax=Pleurodeles waltl TaxID=8319 RepID=A0AAV7M417_PLEWA|nr:hypothetical protein NDU88_002970 [Pleurodeles waltl]
MEFDDNREALLGDLFLKNITRSKTQSTNMTNKDGLKVKFMALEKLKKQELAKWWDGATLKKYMENKRIPRGLQILIFLNFEDLEADLLQEWEEGLHEASYKMMNILVTNSERKVKKLREEINRLEKEIKELNLMEATQKNYEILKKELSCYQLYLKDKKNRRKSIQMTMIMPEDESLLLRDIMMMYSSIKILNKTIAIGTQVLLHVAYLSLHVIVIREKAQVTPSI